ncbi:MAG: FHA domain-containing protein [Faecousia sp.]
MNLIRCENGHFYDAERFPSCPHCNQTTISTVLENTEGDKLYTKPLTEYEVVKSENTDEGVTIGYFGAIGTEPVVGWLVAIGGAHFGTDFKLKAGRNFIGRAAGMDVALSGDPSISREKHAIILYEPKANIFLVQPGDAKELFYLNDKVVLTATEINAYDVITLGESKLLFIPCCGEKFNWDAARAEREKEEKK